MSKFYRIMGRYRKDAAEEIDTAESKEEANYERSTWEHIQL